MLIMFIGLLFSITIGNVLCAMDGQTEIVIDADNNDLVTTSLTEESDFNSVLSSSSKTITTLDGMKSLSKQIFNSQRIRSRNKTGFPEQGEFKIPGHITISPQVFAEYADMENLITVSKPGCFRRMFHCRQSDKKKPFKFLQDKSPDIYKMWAKSILALSSERDDQIEATTGYSLELEVKKISPVRHGDVVEAENQSLELKPFDSMSAGDNDTVKKGKLRKTEDEDNVDSWVTTKRAIAESNSGSSHSLEKIFSVMPGDIAEAENQSSELRPVDSRVTASDDDTVERLRISEERLRGAEWENEYLKEESKLNRNILKLIEKQRGDEANSVTRKERALSIFLLVVTFLATYYS